MGQNDDLGEIRFKPLTEGLGLNHFKDGLPYSPSPSAQKMRNALKNPSAAVSVSRRDELIPAATNNAVATAAASAAVAAAAAITPPQFSLNPLLSSARTQSQVSEESSATMSVSFPASAIRRSLAYGFDVSIMQMLFVFIVTVGFRVNGFEPAKILLSRQAYALIGPLFLLNVVFYLAYFLIQEVTWKTTLGKMLFGLRVEGGSAFMAILRIFLYFLSFLPLGMGLVWYFFDPRKRCWHDVVTNTDVVVS